jgi:hypothetical protein
MEENYIYTWDGQTLGELYAVGISGLGAISGQLAWLQSSGFLAFEDGSDFQVESEPYAFVEGHFSSQEGLEVAILHPKLVGLLIGETEDLSVGSPSSNVVALDINQDGLDEVIWGENGSVVIAAFTTESVDSDKDGFYPPEDCDDLNSKVHPGVDESCNDRDDDCDGIVDNISYSDWLPEKVALIEGYAVLFSGNPGRCVEQIQWEYSKQGILSCGGYSCQSFDSGELQATVIF